MRDDKRTQDRYEGFPRLHFFLLILLPTQSTPCHTAYTWKGLAASPFEDSSLKKLKVDRQAYTPARLLASPAGSSVPATRAYRDNAHVHSLPVVSRDKPQQV
ncbi:hypothetical protein EV361DRAFT_895619 [Lentinula raphanica]|nr:hypothetical protein EV361DRAFT_895619 [Lentinula raphanica]